jgi:hypothetical protein
MRVVAMLPIVALAACSVGADDGSPVAVDATAGTLATAPTSATTTDVPDAAEVFGLPERVVVAVTIDEMPGDDGDPVVATFDVSPGGIDPSAVGLDSAFASCWAVEGPDWLPVEVVVAAGDGSSIRIVESSVVARQRAVPDDIPGASDGVEVSITLDRGDGRPVLADGRLVAEPDARRGRVEALTEDGRSLVADYRCDGDVATTSETAVVEVSLRLVAEGNGADVVRTVSLRGADSTICRSGGEDEGVLLSVVDARWTAGGFTGITVSADGTVTARVLGDDVVARGARLDGTSGMGVLSAVTDDDARLDGAWSCRGPAAGRG